MQDLQSRRSILRNGTKAIAATAGVAGLTGNAAAYSDWGISIIPESGAGSGSYKVRVPYGGSGWEVNGSDQVNESDDTLDDDKQAEEIVITGNLGSDDDGDYWSTQNTPEPYVVEAINCSITIA